MIRVPSPGGGVCAEEGVAAAMDGVAQEPQEVHPSVAEEGGASARLAMYP